MRTLILLSVLSLSLAACSSTPPEMVHADPVLVNEIDRGPFKTELPKNEHEIEIFVANVEPNKRTTFTLLVSDDYNTRCVWEDVMLDEGIEAAALQGEAPPSDKRFGRATRLAFVRTCGEKATVIVKLESGAKEDREIIFNGRTRQTWSVLLGRDGILIAEMEHRKGTSSK